MEAFDKFAQAIGEAYIAEQMMSVADDADQEAHMRDKRIENLDVAADLLRKMFPAAVDEIDDCGSQGELARLYAGIVSGRV